VSIAASAAFLPERSILSPLYAPGPGVPSPMTSMLILRCWVPPKDPEPARLCLLADFFEVIESSFMTYGSYAPGSPVPTPSAIVDKRLDLLAKAAEPPPAPDFLLLLVCAPIVAGGGGE